MGTSRRHSVAGSVAVGLALVAAGTLWVLHNFDVISVPIRVYWPLILVAVGVTHLAGAGTVWSLSGWVLIALGGAFLTVTTGHLAWSEIWRFSPVLLILVGIVVIATFLRRRGEPVPPATPSDGEEELDVTALFGGIDRRVNSPAFRGGRVHAVFGGGQLDLRDSRLHAEGAVVEVSAIFGGVELTVPRDWPLQVRAAAVLGGVENKTSNPTASDGPRLVVKASAIFGGVELKN